MKTLLVALACIPLLAACNKEAPAPVTTAPVVQPDTSATAPVAEAPTSTQAAVVAPAMEAPATTTPAMPMAEASATADASAAMTGNATGKSGDGTYVVVEGDTLWSIADRNGIPHGDLAKWNNINDPKEMKVGRKLRLTAP